MVVEFIYFWINYWILAYGWGAALGLTILCGLIISGLFQKIMS